MTEKIRIVRSIRKSRPVTEEILGSFLYAASMGHETHLEDGYEGERYAAGEELTLDPIQVRGAYDAVFMARGKAASIPFTGGELIFLQQRGVIKTKSMFFF